MTKREVRIVDYDPQWAMFYEKERDQILGVIGHLVIAIEHIGSTAVCGLGGKPIIDIMVGVYQLTDADNCIEPLRSIGYEYVPKFETEFPERRYLHKEGYHLHIVEKRSYFWKRHLLFRDYLRSHPEVAQQYYQLKKELASKHGSNREAYTKAKTSFIESIVAKAMDKHT